MSSKKRKVKEIIQSPIPAEGGAELEVINDINEFKIGLEIGQTLTLLHIITHSKLIECRDGKIIRVFEIEK